MLKITSPFAVLAFSLLSISLSTSLQSFQTCPQLLEYMVENAAKRVGPWGLRAPGFCFFRSKARSFQGLAFAASAPVSSAPVEGTDFSGTNVQVSGVDEPDIVKTDGERVFTISRSNFLYTEVTKSGMNGKVVANLTLPTRPREMLFDSKSDSVVVISQDYEQIPPVKRPINARIPNPYSRSRPVIVLYRISVQQPGKVKITDRAFIQGRYVSARSVGDVGRLVFTYDASDHIAFYKPGGKLTQQESTKENIEVIKKTDVLDWVPTYNATGIECHGSSCISYQTEKKQISGCSTIYYPKGEFSGYSFLTVATFSLGDSFFLKGSSIAADGQTVYSTTDSLYAATTEYQYDLDEFDFNIGRGFKTSFHKFALTGNNAKYVASGEVQGSVLNQFSMHEYKDTFFVATTEGSPWWGSRDTSVSKVSAFRARSRFLKKVGEVGGLGKGERIFAVRYIADVAYVVTFRRVDPLYIVDLSKVNNLQVTGELKIPGYSAYLHPITPGRILGVGRDATETGRTTGAKVSLFDVSNVKKPIELTSWTLNGSYTTAEWEHKAFLWWAPQKIAVLPLSVYYRDTRNRFVGSIILDVSDKLIEERGRVSHECCGRWWSKNILRNFVIARRNLWSFSSNALQVNDIKSLKTKSSILLFPSTD